jgi:hypothetical protein
MERIFPDAVLHEGQAVQGALVPRPLERAIASYLEDARTVDETAVIAVHVVRKGGDRGRDYRFETVSVLRS